MNHPLPRGWQEKKISDISEVTSSKRIYEKEYVKNGIPFYRGKEITLLKNKEKIKELFYISEERYIELKNNYGVPKKNDILITAVGTIGNAYMIDDDKPFYFKDGNLIWLKNIKEYPKFLEFLFEYNQNKILEISMGSSQKALTIIKLENLSFYFPPLDEQKRIAEVLSLCDKLIENLTKLIEKKEIYKKGVMQRVLTGKVRFNGFTDEWETVRLGDIATITSAGVDKKINDNETKVRLLNYLDVFNRNKLYDNEISFITSANENQIKKCDIKKGDLFITPSSEDREGIAKSAVAMEDFTNVVYSYHIIRLRFNREIDLKFKSYMCDTALFHRQAYRLCDGSGQRYVISLGTFREMEIYIPKSVEEQKKIGELLSLIDQDIDNLKQLLHLRKLQKKGLMQKLLTGEVRI